MPKDLQTWLKDLEEKTGRLPKGTAFMGLSKIDREVFYLIASEEK